MLTEKEEKRLQKLEKEEKLLGKLFKSTFSMVTFVIYFTLMVFIAEYFFFSKGNMEDAITQSSRAFFFLGVLFYFKRKEYVLYCIIKKMKATCAD